MTDSIVLHSDNRKRLNLAKAGLEADRLYRVTKHENGNLLLEPVVMVTERELEEMTNG